LTDPRLLPQERQHLPFASDRERQLFVEVRVSGDTLAAKPPGVEPSSVTSLTFEVPCKLGRGLFSVLQKLNLETVPVKSLNLIALGEVSERMSGRQLKTRGPEETGSSQSKGAAGGAAPAGGPPAGAAAGGAEASAKLMDRDKGDSGSMTKNKLERKRYLDVTAQVRRMPLAMIVLVDQDYMQDLLRALANSKLRMQTTQVYWNHDSAPKSGTASRSSAGPGAPPGIPAAVGGANQAKPQQGPDDQESNVVQLVFYGIISLYERPTTPATATK
jgi:hypothetical protein